LFRITMMNEGDPTTYPVPTTPGLINYGLFYGIGQSTSLTFLSGTIGVNSTANAGIIASPIDATSLLTMVELPGTSPGESDVWLQVKGWSASFGTDWALAEQAVMEGVYGAAFGQTDVRNVSPLGPTQGPGAAIWQFTTGTNPNRFYPFTIVVVPEPSGLVLASLGAAALTIARRRR